MWSKRQVVDEYENNVNLDGLLVVFCQTMGSILRNRMNAVISIFVKIVFHLDPEQKVQCYREFSASQTMIWEIRFDFPVLHHFESFHVFMGATRFRGTYKTFETHRQVFYIYRFGSSAQN